MPGKLGDLHWGWALAVVLLLVAIVVLEVVDMTSGFENDGNRLRFQQVGLGGASLYDKQYEAAQKKSELTGSRDIPVFFQDYDYDMIKKGGAMYTSREGLDDRSPEADIEKRMLGG